MNTIKFRDSAKCPACGGMLAYDASMTQRLPIGLGFAPNSARFQIDVLERKGWRGECMNCYAPVFAIVSAKHVTRYPRSINRKIQAAQAA